MRSKIFIMLYTQNDYCKALPYELLYYSKNTVISLVESSKFQFQQFPYYDKVN